MRNWRKYWCGVKPRIPQNLDESLRQVGKTAMGQPVKLHQLVLIVDAIITGLELTPEDLVVDLGCGNGVVTERVAERVARVAGIDVSKPLLEAARSNHARTNCTYHVGDLAELGSLPIEDVTKAYSYEVLQYLSTEETRAMLRTLIEQLGDSLLFFVGGIPERSRLKEFYNTPARCSYYKQRIAEGTEQFGHWWERDELVSLCAEFGLTCTPKDQTASLYTSHYRFDATVAA